MKLKISKPLAAFSFKYHSINNNKKIISDKININGIDTDHIFNNIRLSKIFYEHDLLLHLHKTIESKDKIIIDIGANIGNHSIYFGKYLSHKVIAIEPSKIHCNILKKNLSNNLPSEKFQIHQIAVGNKVGKVNLIFLHETNLGSATIDESKNNASHAIEEVSIDKLDNIITEDNIYLLKIDVEGVEIDVLKGSENIIKANSPHIIVEAHNNERLEEIKNYLQKFNYTILGRFCSAPTYHFINESKHKKNNLSYLMKVKYYIAYLLNKLNKHL